MHYDPINVDSEGPEDQGRSGMGARTCIAHQRVLSYSQSEYCL